MDQQIQESYLSAMGVSSWYPRFSLPNAPELSWPVPENLSPSEDVLLVDSPQVELEVVGDSLAKLKSLMGEDDLSEGVLSKPSDVVVNQTVASVSSSPVSQEIVEPFAFLFFRYPLGVTLAVTLPVEDSLSSMDVRFLNSVLSYLNIEPNPEFSHRVDWPLVKTSKTFYTRQFFEGSMSALFEKQALNCGANTFLLFGKRLSDELTDLLLSLSSEDQKTTVITSSDLPTLYMSAQAKRDLWVQLKALKAND